MNQRILNWNKWALISVYLVILAGSVVRMTGSGMGCPDWPKCFGYLIPPTERSQLDWKPSTDYKKGNVIIVDESLRVAVKDFESGLVYEPDLWEPYTKHDYAKFDAAHTWIEFINRLLGALSGLFVLGLFVQSLALIRQKPIVSLLCFLAVAGMGFQAWLGKTVVDSNLLPTKISIHMAMALVIIGLLLIVRALCKPMGLAKKPSSVLMYLIGFAFVLTIAQFVLGVQVRQFVDVQIQKWGYEQAALWLQHPKLDFYIHRSLSILVVLVNGWIFFKVRQEGLAEKYIRWILGFVLVEILLGIAMFYIDFPWGSQPLHLLIATLLFGVQAYWILRINTKKYDLSI
ncbi:MAG: COX15/CtaA family protein [Flavobacteriaceae bacterium]